MIELGLDCWEVEAGGKVTVRARRVPGAGKPPGALLVQVGWRTEGRGNVESKRVNEAEPILAGEECAVALAIPPEGPPSHDGKLIRIIWEVTVRPADPMGAGPAPVASADFRVIPRRVRR